MLVKMRSAAQSWIAKFVACIIIVVLVLFGFGAFNLFQVTEPIIASVDGEDITESRLANEIERAKQDLRNTYGENISNSQLDEWVDDQFALKRLIDTQLFTNATEELGLRLSDVRFQEAIQENPVFQNDGEFNEATFRETLQRGGLSAQSYRELEEDAEVRRQLLNVLETTSFATPRETSVYATFDKQTRSFSSLTFSISAFEDAEAVTEELVVEEYELNPDLYMTNGEFDFEYIELSNQQFLPEEDPTEEEIRDLYDNEVAAKNSGAQRKGSHILIKVDEDRTKEEALEEINGIAQQLKDGSDFREIATEFSEDVGSAEKGGDLGFASRSTFVKPFADQLWSMDVGEISDPVETTFGYHIIKLDEIEELEIETFETRKPSLVEEHKAGLAMQELTEQESNLDKLAFENSNTLVPIADEYGIEVQTIENVDSFSSEGILVHSDVRNALFDTDVVDNNFNSRVVNLSGESLIVGRLLDHRPPVLRDLEDVREQITTAIGRELAETARDDALASALSQLQDHKDFDSAEKAADATWEVYENQEKATTSIDPAIVETAFETPLLSSEERVITEAVSEFSDDKFIVVVTSQDLAQFGVLANSVQDEVTESVKSNSQTQLLSSFMAGLRGSASIKSEVVVFDE